jgi:hydrogenase maturation protein HypF
MPVDVIHNLSLFPAQVRLKVVLCGAVQGVGFRPFVHRLATELKLAGWVNNSPQGVFVEVESTRRVLEEFLHRLQTDKPPLSFIQSFEATWLDAVGYPGFEIRASDTTGSRTALVLPDIATCPECLSEIQDPQNRRFQYPFTNCTHCGPRFSIIEALPYDRANTVMKQFLLCPACQAEYDDPQNRRFHAQPNACPVCGPRLEYWQAGAAPASGDEPPRFHEVLASGHDALRAAAAAIRAGKIVAVKGIGGFHLLADARAEAAVRRLRERKHREEKPFALLFPSIAAVRQGCELSPAEEQLLLSPAAPIVLLAKKSPPPARGQVAPSVAPGNPYLGVMLPSNPLQHLLLAELGFQVVATSGNPGDEPLCTDEFEAVGRLREIADFFLVHNRPIARHVDDSIARVVLGREMVLRRARGYAPLPVAIPVAEGGRPKAPPPELLRGAASKTVLAVGAQLKNAVALAVGGNVFLSQHIGDLETAPAEQAFRRVAADLQTLYGAPAEMVAADLHPDYLSSHFAEEWAQRSGGPPVMHVQHHIAHVLACLAENETPLPALGVAWDGTGYGTDGTIWGGEFFMVTAGAVERVATLRPFRLPGSNTAVKEPRRAALGMLFEMFGNMIFEQADLAPVAAFAPGDLALLKTMLNRDLNSPKTSSIGRWFDAVAAIVNLRQTMRFEGQAAMDLEFALAGIATDKFYNLPLVTRHAMCFLDWSPTIGEIVLEARRDVSAGEISAKFHNTLAEVIVSVARRFGVPRVALSGGCFQNRYLLERAVTRLRAERFQPYWHQRVPTNDGGIALGQVMAVRRAQGPMTVVNK